MLFRPTAAFAFLVLAVAPAVSRADYVRGQPIFVRNDTARPLWVAAHYVPAGSCDFVTGGWWKVDPGECRLIVYNNGVHIYFNAHDDNGAVWDGSATTVTLEGKTLNMFHADTGQCYDPWTVTFR